MREAEILQCIWLTAGALLAAVTDLSFNLFGYTAVIGNDFATALYLIMVKNTPAASALTTTVSVLATRPQPERLQTCWATAAGCWPSPTRLHRHLDVVLSSLLMLVAVGVAICSSGPLFAARAAVPRCGIKHGAPISSSAGGREISSNYGRRNVEKVSLQARCALLHCYRMHISIASGLVLLQGLLFYNAALSVPLLAVAVAASHEPAIMRAYPLIHDKGFQVHRPSHAGHIQGDMACVTSMWSK